MFILLPILLAIGFISEAIVERGKATDSPGVVSLGLLARLVGITWVAIYCGKHAEQDYYNKFGRVNKITSATNIDIALSRMTYWKAIVAIGLFFFISSNRTSVVAALPGRKELEAIDAIGYHCKGIDYYCQSIFDKAIEEWHKAIQLVPDNPHISYDLACAYVQLEQRANAIDSLKMSIALSRKVIDWVKTDTIFDNIREEPEFQQLINVYTHVWNNRYTLAHSRIQELFSKEYALRRERLWD